MSSLHEKKIGKRQGSISKALFAKCKGSSGEKPTMDQLRRGAYLHVYTYVLMFFGTIVGVAVLGISISWNLLTFEPYDPMKRILSFSSLIFQSFFLVLTITIQDRVSMWIYLDFAILILTGLADWNFFARSSWGRFGSVDLFIFIILTGYMVLRFWTTMLRLKYNPVKSAHKRRNGFEVMDKVHLVWTTRSPTLVSQMFPDLEKIWNTLVEKFGEDFARLICDISIYCTSNDDNAIDDLEYELEETSLYKMGALKFERPNFPTILDQHTTERMLNKMSLAASRTLVAFCGSPALGSFVKEVKIRNDLGMFIAGVDNHVTDLVIESYGGTKRKEVKKNKKEEDLVQDAERVENVEGKKDFRAKLKIQKQPGSRAYS